VTSFASREVITAKCPFAVMTAHAALAATGRMVIQRFGGGDLPPLRHAGAHLMTFIAIDLRLMQGVTEADPECRHILRRASVTTQLMTSATRRDVAPAGLRSWSMAAKTDCVRVEICGYRHGGAALRRPVTSSAANTAHRQMLRVIELHAEADEP
jgi:hypothetical protein